MGLAEDISRLEQALHELIVKYEQYFCGIEKREPLLLLTEVEQLARRYQNISITNTSLRFKYQSLIATLGVHRQKWNRINRLIDEGKYERDRFKMALHSRERDTGSPSPASTPSSPQRPAAQPDPMEKLYNEYLEARSACNLPTENISRAKIAAAVEQKLQDIKARRGSEVELRVVIEGGKPRIKVRGKN